MHEATVQETDQQELKRRLFDLLLLLAVERQAVALASGQTSSVYIDCRQVYFRGDAQFIIGELFYQAMVQNEVESSQFAACGGMALGSIPLSCALSAAAFRRGREIPGFTVRKEPKLHGMKSMIEGNKCLRVNDRILLLEDVVTTGGSAIRAINELRKEGVEIDTMLSIVDREQGGEGHLLKEGVKLCSLFRLSDFMR